MAAATTSRSWVMWSARPATSAAGSATGRARRSTPASTCSTASPGSRVACSTSFGPRSARCSRSCAALPADVRGRARAHADRHARARHRRDRPPLRRHRHRGVLRRRAPADGTGGSAHRVMVVAGINSSGLAGDSRPNRRPRCRRARLPPHRGRGPLLLLRGRRWRVRTERHAAGPRRRRAPAR